MTSPDAPNLDDAKAWLNRARHHYDEINGVIYAEPGHLWNVSDGQDPKTGEWLYRLNLDRKRLVTAKIIVAECATAISSALDHITAAIARARKPQLRKRVLFPWGSTDELFKERLENARGKLGDEMTVVIENARAKHRHEVPHVHAAKKISGAGKHWSLLATLGSAHGIAHYAPGIEQRVFGIPDGAFKAADQFEFHRNKERLPTEGGWEILVGLTVDGLDEGLPKSPDSIFPCSFRFVQGVIDAAEQAARDDAP